LYEKNRTYRNCSQEPGRCRAALRKTPEYPLLQDRNGFQTGPNKIELLESADPEGVIARFIDKKGEGLHHIAFEVADIYAEMERLKKEGFVLLNPEPRNGADNKLICFLHPKHCNGVLIELCMSKEVTVEV
jgi:catechol 2,3-dioxygenase-like lactoylglutathione lyase family enzyme